MPLLDMGDRGIMVIPREDRKMFMKPPPELGLVPMCTDCVHHDDGVGLSRCRAPANWQCEQFLSSGMSCVAEFASDARRNENMCGNDARHFKKK